MTIDSIIMAIVFLPLLAAIGVGLTCHIISNRAAHILTCGAMVVSALFAGSVFMDFARLAVHEGENWKSLVGPGGLVYKIELMPWITSGDFVAKWLLRVDALTAVMLIVVTWVSAVVHLYSVGYMHEDPHQPRFMAYLSLFTFFMLMLVTADNFVQMFLGWEGVGLCSYLLIGFWFKKAAPNAAAIKAFLVNRVGDIGFALGIFTCFVIFGSVEFDTVFAAAESKKEMTLKFLGHEYHAMTVLCLLLFVGAMGKSAQLGLHTWLPDAMEGPTPVSALIHAATMVTAGVFMVVRCSPLFDQSPTALEVVTVIGALTAFFAATIGLVQNDIKRVIAYSTCSQLGYMFFAAGVGAYAAAIFHLMTHAFFKALLFLGAGSVIHGMHHEQDMRKMGGIWKLMPITYVFMWIGSLALAGLPFFSGYYSKDVILEAAYTAQSPFGRFAFILGILAALMTAFYSWRLIFMTFHGKPRASHHTMEHVHESPNIMLAPLYLLVAGSLFAGYIGAHVLGMISGDDTFWQATIASHEAVEAAHHAPGWVKLSPIFVGLIGIGFAFLLYIKRVGLADKIAKALPNVYRILLNKWYVDELYDFLFVNPAKRLGTHLSSFWDARIIDGFGPNGAAWLSQRFGQMASRLQTGFLFHYAFAMLLGLLGFITWVMYAHG